MHLRFSFLSLGVLASASILAACSSSVVDPTGTGGGGHGGHGGHGGTGGTVEVQCTWATKTNNATCKAGACPITLDEELHCGDLEFGAPGLRVAPAPDATWLVTSSSNDRQVYRLAGGSAERHDELPAELARTTIALALANDGTVHLASDNTQTPDYEGGVVHASNVGGTFKTSKVFDNPNKFSPVVDMEMSSDGQPLVWVVTDAPSAYSLFTPTQPEGWSMAAAPVPEAGAWNRFTRGSDGSLVSLAFKSLANGGSQLHALVNGADRSIGKPSLDFSTPDMVVAAAPGPKSPSDRIFTVALAYEDGIHVFGEAASGPAVEKVIPNVSAPVPTCTPPDPSMCTGATCHETSVGMEDRAFALAWTDEGVAYLAYVITTHDQQIGYSLQGDPGVEDCWGNVESDSSKGTLHLVRVRFDDSAPEEVLTMPIERPAGVDAFSDFNSSVRFLDARAFGSELAIGLRTGWVTEPHAVRVLRIDTSKL